jgi:hypothetical protein
LLNVTRLASLCQTRRFGRTTRTSLLAAESAVSEGWEPVPSGDQPAFGAWNTVGGQWRWSQIHCRRSPGPRSGALVDSRRRGPVEPAGRPAVEHGPGRNRPRRPHFTRPERTGCTRADPEAATTVHPDRTRRRRHELPPAVRRSDARHHSGGSATETNIRPKVPTDDRHRMFPAAGSGCRDVRRDAVLVRAYLCWWPLARAFPPSGPDAIGQSGCPTGDYATWRVQRAGAGLPDRPNG